MRACVPSRRRGQATTEFVVMAAMITAPVLILSLFLWTFKQYGGRVLSLLASEFP